MKRWIGVRTKLSSNIAGWAKIRKLILERDGWMCRVCQKDGGESALNVHHIDWERTNNDHDNLVTLCQTCHKGVHEEGYKPWLYEDWPVPWGAHP